MVCPLLFPSVPYYFQKWLKDRKGRMLDFQDIQHYQKIIHALSETHRLMQEVDTVFQLTSIEPIQ